MTTFAFNHTWGVSDIRGIRASEGHIDDVFPLASVTKIVATYAMLIAVDRHMVSLDSETGPQGSTLRHLLAHSSGLPFEAGAVLSAPGTRRVYSNLGIEKAGEYVSESCATSIQDWIEETVLIPLGMSNTVIEGSPAHSGVGSLRDLLTFGRELLSPTLVTSETFTQATSVQFPGLSGILPGFGRQKSNDWGLGFELRGHKSPHWLSEDFPAETFGHFGQSGSFVWVDRSIGRCGAFLGSLPFGQQHRDQWPELTARMRLM